MSNRAEIIKRAEQLTRKGYSVIPVDDLKNPKVKGWADWQTRPMTPAELDTHFVKNDKATGVALLMGGPRSITATDFDLKYDLTGELYNKVLEKIPTSIYKKCMVNKTKNGGYHWIFSCEKGLGNIKLAQRETTDQEVWESMTRNLETMGAKQAMKTALGDKVRVLIETRSFTSTIRHDGSMSKKADGYVLFPPSNGYQYVEGNLGVLTGEELDHLLTVMRSFNTFTPEKYNLKTSATLGNDVWEEANNRLDTLAMLQEVGWRVVWENSEDVRLLRPGQVTSATSGIYHRDTKVFVCFSSSTVFEPGKGYSPAMVFIELEDGDAAASKEKLMEILKQQ